MDRKNKPSEEKKLRLRTGRFYLNGDKHGNVWITEMVSTEDGENVYEKRVSGYMRTPIDAVMNMVDRKLYTAGVGSIKELAAEAEKIIEDAKKIVEAYYKEATDES